MTDIIFSGKTARCDIPHLKSLFGINVPVEAINFIFECSGDMTLGEARAHIDAMAKVWDQPKFQLQRLQTAASSITSSVQIAAARLAAADETERVYLINDFHDAAENLEAADQDALFLRQERDE